MSTFDIAALGTVAGFTIFLGLPVGRVRSLPSGMRTFLNATATGVLLFLLWDVLNPRCRTDRDGTDCPDAGRNGQLGEVQRPGCGFRRQA